VEDIGVANFANAKTHHYSRAIHGACVVEDDTFTGIVTVSGLHANFYALDFEAASADDRITHSKYTALSEENSNTGECRHTLNGDIIVTGSVLHQFNSSPITDQSSILLSPNAIAPGTAEYLIENYPGTAFAWSAIASDASASPTYALYRFDTSDPLTAAVTTTLTAFVTDMSMDHYSTSNNLLLAFGGGLHKFYDASGTELSSTTSPSNDCKLIAVMSVGEDDVYYVCGDGLTQFNSVDLSGTDIIQQTAAELVETRGIT
jgi:hypothetical protein